MVKEIKPLKALENLAETIKWCANDGKKLPKYDEKNYKIVKKELSKNAKRLTQIESNLKRWSILLGKDGMNSKAVVRNEIEAILEELR